MGLSKDIFQKVDELGIPQLKKEPSCVLTVERKMYQPPESLEAYDQCTDLFIMGLILFEMLSEKITNLDEREKWHYNVSQSLE